MPRAAEHRLINFAATAIFLASKAEDERRGLKHPLVGGAVSALCATFPDVLEPPIHPHHRQMFHSLVFASAVGYGVYRVYHWKPQDWVEELIRLAVLFGGSAYLLHLAADLCTTRSLPLAGK